MAYALWVTFFDQSNLIQLFRLKKEKKLLQKEMTFYRQQTEDLQRKKAQLTGNTTSIETFAREQYFMKRDNEDVFVVIEE